MQRGCQATLERGSLVPHGFLQPATARRHPHAALCCVRVTPSPRNRAARLAGYLKARRACGNCETWVSREEGSFLGHPPRSFGGERRSHATLLSRPPADARRYFNAKSPKRSAELLR